MNTPTKSRSDFNAVPDGRVPITLGITGHRHVHSGAIADISERLGTLFDQFKAAYPSSPVYLISALAEGSDQLAATIALDKGIELCAVLPMHKADYVEDFDKPAVRETFEALIIKSSHCRTLSTFDSTRQRDLCYAHVGQWVVNQSDVVIALWDGDQNGLTGGTGEVVNYALSGEFPSLELEVASHEWLARTRPVIHIHTPRQSASLPDTLPETVLYENTDALLRTQSTRRPDAMKALSELANLQRIDSFNETVAGKDDKPGYPLLPVETSELPAHLRFIHQLYLKSDLVANQFQSVFKRYTILFYTLTAALMTTLLLYFRVFPFAFVLAFYVLLYLITIVVSVRIRNSDFQRKYHLYRSVGEISRLFFFFKLSETGRKKRKSVLNSFREVQYMTRKLGEDNTWYLDALRKIELFEKPAEAADSLVDPMALVNKHWIQDQCAYFLKALNRDERKLRLLNRLGIFLFVISFVCGIGLVAISYLKLPFFDLVKPGLSSAIGISVGLGGILKTYTYTMGLSELAGRYRLMHGLFEHAIERMANDEAHKDAIFEQLWWEALMENIEWFSLKDSRLVSTISAKTAVQRLAGLAKLKT